ncbi:uncharacterized protein EHS24_009710 [Apiotrichum porosum]|jgi:hypothetical protein|uniref:Uncharacterized protein n=1 Tax=Apiotrichum porosum TaxID=105984 RepID=A0A427XMI8_9TREE|nr:uncharacterized protein EHS24_009710 [Apiotrichum porosum]RSH80038.1 hypothetical protein EHS24_009710 [Apiotrichum porosum]
MRRQAEETNDQEVGIGLPQRRRKGVERRRRDGRENVEGEGLGVEAPGQRRALCILAMDPQMKEATPCLPRTAWVDDHVSSATVENAVHLLTDLPASGPETQEAGYRRIPQDRLKDVWIALVIKCDARGRGGWVEWRVRRDGRFDRRRATFGAGRAILAYLDRSRAHDGLDALVGFGETNHENEMIGDEK